MTADMEPALGQLSGEQHPCAEMRLPPDWHTEETIVTLWQAGTPTATVARALGIPLGTVGSRAYTLVKRSAIQPPLHPARHL